MKDTVDLTTARGALRRRSLKTLLVGLVVAVLVPCVAGGLIGTYRMVQSGRAVAENGLRDTAKDIAHLVDHEFSEQFAALNALTVSPAFNPNPASPDLPMLYPHARRIALQLGARILVLHRDGAALLTTQLPLGVPLPGTSANTRALLERVFATGRPALGDLTIVIAVPVRDSDGQVVLAVATSL